MDYDRCLKHLALLCSCYEVIQLCVVFIGVHSHAPKVVEVKGGRPQAPHE